MYIDRAHAVDWAKLSAFLESTQPEAFEELHLAQDGPSRQQFLHRLQGETAKRGIVDMLRKGVKHGPATVDLFYGTPTPGNDRARNLFLAEVKQSVKEGSARQHDRASVDFASV